VGPRLAEHEKMRQEPTEPEFNDHGHSVPSDGLTATAAASANCKNRTMVGSGDRFGPEVATDDTA